MTLSVMGEALVKAREAYSNFIRTTDGSNALQRMIRLVGSPNLEGARPILVCFLVTPCIATCEEICDQAARQASLESSVPLPVLLSIARAETGRTKDGRLQPWPWTVNLEGIGQWFDTEGAAHSYVLRHFKRGVRNFDVGCFQINYRWHGTAFRSIDHMFDPLENARYAASFLRKLYRETGDWSLAAGTYHSRTPELASRYRDRFDRILQRHQKPREIAKLAKRHSVDQANTSTERSHTNNYPLLQNEFGNRTFGSLVPLSSNQANPAFQQTNIRWGS